MENDGGSSARRKSRSPAYPGIDLETAIQRAQQLYDSEGRHDVPVGQVAAVWGYGPKSSGAGIAVSALKKFELLSDEGRRDLRHVRLTQLALKILIDPATRPLSIQQAALAPSIHREVWERYGPDLPSDGTMRTFLLLERGFTEAGVRDFLAQFRATVEFADLAGASAPSSYEQSAEREDGEVGADEPAPSAVPDSRGPVHFPPSEPLETTPSAGRSISIPVSPGTWVALSGEFPLSSKDWDQMMAVLDAMKPALSVDDE